MENYKIGINDSEAKTVVISGILETTGQVRFGDGTEINLTVTEKDLIPTRAGDVVEKVVFAGSKRRGVDRRTAHDYRNNYIDFAEEESTEDDCYIPALCLQCPTCWVYGGTGSTGDTDIDYNIKSRIQYSTAYSIERSEMAVRIHSRNRVNEKTQSTGQAGIHREEFIKGGVHFPVNTVLKKMNDWEIGIYAQAFLDNINQNNYTAGTARQGGIKVSEKREGEKEPILIVDISPKATFPLETFKVSPDQESFNQALQEFKECINLDKIKNNLSRQGFKIKNSSEIFEVESGDDTIMKIEKENDIITVKSEEENLIMKRYIGNKALGYLKKRVADYQSFLENFQWKDWEEKRSKLEEYLGVE